MYSVKELGEMAGVSARTLHYYDQIGLLVPERNRHNRYRTYSRTHLLKLQQILFFRELDLPLEEIRKIINDPLFDTTKALRYHRRNLLEREKRITKLVATIDRTIAKLEGEIEMTDKDLYQGFSEEKQKEYEQEVREKYGEEPLNTSIKNWNSLSKEEQKQMIADGHRFHQKIADTTHLGHDHPEVQDLMRQYWQNMQFFYEVSLDRYEALGHMYNQDNAFRATYESIKPGLAAFMEKAIEFFVKSEKNKKSA